MAEKKPAPFGEKDKLETLSNDLDNILRVLELPPRTKDGMHQTIWLDVMPMLYKLMKKKNPNIVKGR